MKRNARKTTFTTSSAAMDAVKDAWTKAFARPIRAAVLTRQPIGRSAEAIAVTAHRLRREDRDRRG
jgi:hypothetical protein